MIRHFNTAGPCNREEHYMIEAATRLQGVEQLIDKAQYFVIHAPQQSGKTTYLYDLTRRLNESGKYYALYCSLESLQCFKDAEKGIPELVKTIKAALYFSSIPNKEEFAKEANYFFYSTVLNIELVKYCKGLDKPLVILFNEVDCLSKDMLRSFLPQLREGYNERSTVPFVHSLALVGMQKIRDYKVRPEEKQSWSSASPFNIVTKTLTLKNFTQEEIASLYRQHTDDTGQVFEQEAIELAYEQTQGQPWLVNAIAREVIEEILQSDYTRPVTASLVEEAIRTLILRRDVHIDYLMERLKEERVRRVIEPIVSGETFFERSSDEYQYVTDLGLIKSIKGKIQPANPIYSEVIVHTLSANLREGLIRNNHTYIIPRYLKDGKIDMDFLMQDFQQFWRENSEVWIEMVQYKEAAPHLILMAFLQRILNGSGKIIREMAAGVGHTDLCIVYQGDKYPIVLKIRRDEKSVAEGIEQTMGYMDTFGCSEGWLVVFDRRPKISWSKKIYIKKETTDGKTVTVVGL